MRWHEFPCAPKTLLLQALRSSVGLAAITYSSMFYVKFGKNRYFHSWAPVVTLLYSNRNFSMSKRTSVTGTYSRRSRASLFAWSKQLLQPSTSRMRDDQSKGCRVKRHEELFESGGIFGNIHRHNLVEAGCTAPPSATRDM